MKTFKKIAYPLFSLFLLYRTIVLVEELISSDPMALSNNEMLRYALLLALFITGIFAFPGFAFPTNKILPEGYYKIKNPRMLLQVYHALGIKYFNFMLLAVYWGKKNNRRKYFDGTRRGLPNFIYQSKQSEFGHLDGFVTIFIVSIFLIAKGYVILVAILTVINIFGNLYPLILQRYHRIRIEKLIN
jgi:hypothetical protein